MPGRYVSRKGEPMVNRGIYIPASLMERVQALAQTEERTVADVFRRAIRVGLDALERRRRPAAEEGSAT